MGDGDGDGARAGADVDDALRLIVREAFDDGFDEEFGFGARDEDGWGDAEGEAVELRLAEDVLDGFEAEAAFDEALVGGLLGAVEGALGVRDEGGTVDAEGMQEQERGVGQCGGTQVGVGGELVGSSGECFAEGEHQVGRAPLKAPDAIHHQAEAADAAGAPHAGRVLVDFGFFACAVDLDDAALRVDQPGEFDAVVDPHLHLLPKGLQPVGFGA